MSKQFWAIVAVIVVVLVGVFILTSDKKDESGGSTAAASNHVKGEGSTGVTLVEYGDFQCVYCAAYYPTIQQVLESYGDQIKFQFVNFPITNIHQNAYAASRAAEAAGKQGKYWEMYDLLFQNSQQGSGWTASNAPTTFFERYATQIGLDIEKFKTDSNSSAVNDIIRSDMTKGEDAGVEGTPTFFLDGKKVTIGNTADDFKKVIDEAIKAKSEGRESDVTSSGNAEQSTDPEANEQQ